MARVPVVEPQRVLAVGIHHKSSPATAGLRRAAGPPFNQDGLSIQTRERHARYVLRRHAVLAAFRGEPVCGVMHDLGRDRVAALELAVRNVVAGTPELGDDPAAAAVYGEHGVARTVGDEDERGARPRLLAGAANPGEKASTWVNRSPLVIPNESA